MSFHVGFIGGGNMSTAIFKGILRSGAHPPSNIWVSGPHIERLQYWIDQGAHASIQNIDVFNNCDIVFLGVKPHLLDAALKIDSGTAIKPEKKILFVSMLAGMKIEKVQTAIRLNLSCRSSVLRIMPNTPITVGAGICIYTPDSTVTEEQCKIIETLLSGSAICERVPESLVDALGVLTACGPAYMYLVIEALADGAVKQGVPRALATRHAAQTVVGSGQMVLQSGKHPGLLKDEVCSPGGTTISGIAALENGSIRATLINAIESSTRRVKEMGNN